MKVVLLGKDEPRTFDIATGPAGRIAIVMLLRELGWAVYQLKGEVVVQVVQLTEEDDIKHDDTLLVVGRISDEK